MKISNELLFSLMIFIVGVLFGLIFLPFFDIRVEATVSLSDLLSMVMGAFLGIYIAKSITDRQSATRFEKDFLISEVKRITEYMDSNNVFKNTAEIQHSEAKKSFKELNITIINFEIILKESNYSTILDLSDLKKTFKEFRAHVLDIAPNNGTIRPDLSQRFIIFSKYTDLRKQVFKLIIEINNFSQ